MKKMFYVTLCILLFASIGFAATDGSATFSVRTRSTGDEYENRHIIAIWVTDSSGNFVKTLMAFAESRRTHLNRWQAASDPDYDVTGVPDALTGATISSHQTHVVTWDCRDRSGVVVPDGDYRLRVEMTAKNSSGPATPIDAIHFTKGPAAVSFSPSSVTYNSRIVFTDMSFAYTPVAVSHNIAVSTPAVGSPVFIGNSTPVSLTVSNLTSSVEIDVPVVLQNETTGTPIKTNTIASLSGNSSLVVNFSWDTTGLNPGTHTLRVTAGPVPDEVATADNSRTVDTQLVGPTHDLTLSPLTSDPAVRLPGSAGTIDLVVTNTGAYTETFSVVLEDLTDGTILGTNIVSGLASRAATSISFPWDITGSSLGYHLLQVVAGPVTGETSTADNTQQKNVAVASGITTNIHIATGSDWSYQDQGLDLHRSTWKTSTYFAGWWLTGAAPLGYGDSGMNTELSYGPDAQDKFPCTYFRKTIQLDVLPTEGQIRVMRDDGVVIYLNGQEIIRNNMPAGIISNQTYANGAVGGTNETGYHAFSLSEEHLQAGLNVLAAEVHQADPNSSDIRFDLELTLDTPSFPIIRDLAVTQISTPASILAGDQVDVAVQAANLGSQTETAQITLSDASAGLIGTAGDTLAPGASKVMKINWNTMGAATGVHNLSAEVTALSGETVLSNNTLSATANVSSAGWLSQTPGADGSIGGFCSAVAVSGPLACIGEGATLTMLDITSPANPQRLGSLLLDSRIEDLTIVGSVAIAACGPRGVQFIDISDPSSPAYLQTFDTSGHAWRVVADGNRLYAADGVSGLRIFDITTPTSPALLGGYATDGAARSVTVSGTTAYLLDSRNGLLVLNVSDAANPLLIGQYDGISGGADLVLNGNHIYIVGDLARLTTLDISTPSAPLLNELLDLPGPTRSIRLSSGSVAVAVQNSGIQMIDISNPADPALGTLISSTGNALALEFLGSAILLADGEAGLSVLSGATGSYAQSARARQAVTQNDLLYVAAGNAGVRIYDVTNAAAPQLTGAFSAASNAFDVAISPHALYVADGLYGLQLGSLTTPENPAAQERFTSTNLGPVHAVACNNDEAVITDGRSVVLIDASNLNAPTESARYESTGGYLHRLAMNSNWVAVAAGPDGALLLHPTSLALLNTIPADEPVTDVSLDDTTAWLAAGSRWIGADVSTPASPVILATHTGQTTRVLAAENGRVAVQKQKPAVTLLDVTTPLTPVELDSVPALAEALNLSLSERYILAAQDDAGLAIFFAPETDLDGDGLLDSWEQQIVDADLEDEITSMDDVLPNDDFDGDGLSNRAEWIAGTSPIDPNSVFAVIPTQPAPDGYPLRWHSVVGKSYTIHISTDLTQGFTEHQSGITATGTITERTITNAGTKSFFMVTVE